MFGKYLNCGQTCVAPDYMLVHESIKDRFIECVISEIKRQYANLDDYGHIINEKHYKRILGLIWIRLFMVENIIIYKLIQR